MSDGRDPAIKLFGTKIPLLEEQRVAEGDAEDWAPAIDLPLEREKEAKSNTEAAESMMAEPKDTLDSCSLSTPTKNDSKTSTTEASKSAEEPKSEHDHKESNHSGEDKALKKPDKILPCPRCDSMDTKFCYYNNYNVNQPRHFCKNCQRYWTAGGTMRNVPVGAGRRKNKHSPLSYRHPILAPDALASAQLDGPDLTVPKRPANGTSTILKFGPDAPLCESVASLINLGEQKRTSDFVTENREETSCSSSTAVSKPEEYSFPWPHWPYPWSNAILPSPMIPVPAFCAPTPFPFVPASFWGWSGGPWNLSWAGNFNGVSSPSSSTSTVNCSPTLGKHSREAEKSLWVPKTLRIDDPDEAAKSSIFATLGIKLDECCKFRAIQSNAGRRDASDALKLLRSNPAALSRSQSFQETTRT